AVIAALPHVEVKPLHIAPHVDWRGTGSEQLLAHAAEQPTDRVLTSQQQAVRMATLRHAAPRLGPFAALVALDHGDRLEKIGEHARGQQPRHAAADNDGIAEGFALHDDPRTSVVTLENIERVAHAHIAATTANAAHFRGRAVLNR